VREGSGLYRCGRGECATGDGDSGAVEQWDGETVERCWCPDPSNALFVCSEQTKTWCWWRTLCLKKE